MFEQIGEGSAKFHNVQCHTFTCYWYTRLLWIIPRWDPAGESNEADWASAGRSGFTEPSNGSTCTHFPYTIWIHLYALWLQHLDPPTCIGPAPSITLSGSVHIHRHYDIWIHLHSPWIQHPHPLINTLIVDTTTPRFLIKGKISPSPFQNQMLADVFSCVSPGELEVAEREWKKAFYSWKYNDLADWKDEFAKYKAATMN